MSEAITQRSVMASDIRVVDAATVVGGENDKALKAALDTHKDHITALRTAIGNNPAYTAALAAHKEKPVANDVIAVDILDEGDVLVYFRK
jgi:fumarate hydratase class II